MVSMLELRHVSRVYGDGAAEVAALLDVNLAVEAGQLVAVMGPSGSGKSTLLAIAGTLEEPSSGEVIVGGRLVTGASAAERARLRRRAIGYVFQDFNLLPGLTARENVALPLQLDGVLAVRARAAADRALAGLAWLNGPGIFLSSCPGASGSGLRSPGRSSGGGGCSWPMSHRVPSTPLTGNWLCTLSVPPAGKESRRWLSRTTRTWRRGPTGSCSCGKGAWPATPGRRPALGR